MQNLGYMTMNTVGYAASFGIGFSQWSKTFNWLARPDVSKFIEDVVIGEARYADDPAKVKEYGEEYAKTLSYFRFLESVSFKTIKDPLVKDFDDDLKALFKGFPIQRVETVDFLLDEEMLFSVMDSITDEGYSPSEIFQELLSNIKIFLT